MQALSANRTSIGSATATMTTATPDRASSNTARIMLSPPLRQEKGPNSGVRNAWYLALTPQRLRLAFGRPLPVLVLLRLFRHPFFRRRIRGNDEITKVGGCLRQVNLVQSVKHLERLDFIARQRHVAKTEQHELERR